MSLMSGLLASFRCFESTSVMRWNAKCEYAGQANRGWAASKLPWTKPVSVAMPPSDIMEPDDSDGR